MPAHCLVRPTSGRWSSPEQNGAPHDAAGFDDRLKSAVAEVVRRQIESGIDCVNDGELSKTNFTDYVRARIAGYEARPSTGARRLSITARDERKFAGYFAVNPRNRPTGPATMPVCVSELRYVGQADLAKDLDNFTAALAGVSVAGAYLPANTPGTIEHWMLNEYYKNDEAFVFAIADAMHEEYQAIVEAGFLLQIDDPDLPDGWNCLPDITLPEYRKYAAMRVDRLLTPEPCVPVATAPPTEMCGSDARFATARPCSCSARPSSP